MYANMYNTFMTRIRILKPDRKPNEILYTIPHIHTYERIECCRKEKIKKSHVAYTDRILQNKM